MHRPRGRLQDLLSGDRLPVQVQLGWDGWLRTELGENIGVNAAVNVGVQSEWARVWAWFGVGIDEGIGVNGCRTVNECRLAAREGDDHEGS